MKKKFKLTNMILNGYLLKHRVKTKFIEEVNKSDWDHHDIINNEDETDPIYYAFYWDQSDNGDFWSKLNSDYFNYAYALLYF